MSLIGRKLSSINCLRLYQLNIKKCTTNTNSQNDGLLAKDNLPVNVKKLEDQKPQLIVSDSCIKRLREICTDGNFLRITVEGGGCSGFQYKFDLDNKVNDDDLDFGEEKAKVIIDTVSLDYCNGATVDYHAELIRSGFRIIGNPQAEQGCSCGASFALKLD